LVEVLKKTERGTAGLQLPDLDSVEPLLDVAWSGNFLLNTLFKVFDYPVLRTTQQRQKPGVTKKPKPPQPCVDTDAVRDYLKWPAVRSKEEIEAAIKNPDTLEKLKMKSMYLETDYIDRDSGKVLVSKDEFNSKAYPFFLLLQFIAPLEKAIQSDLVPIVSLNSPYRFAASRTTTIVTRRVANSLCIVSGKEKDLYIPYTEDYNWVGMDQASVEVRVANGLSGDESLIAPLRDPEKDPHTETCVEFLNKPAYLVDKKAERGPITAVNFGRVYLREVFSICDQLHEGETTPDNLARVARMVKLYDEKRASVHAALDKYRDECYVPREIPEFVRFFLKINEFLPHPKRRASEPLVDWEQRLEDWEARKTLRYGYMTNHFGYVQHVEIRKEDWHKSSMRRKAGNFAVQGLCATLLRILYTRFLDACWKRGWIQDDRLIVHFTVYDELDMSVHVSLNPIEVASLLRDAFVVTFLKFPPLFVGINFANNWGDTKSDDYEIPMRLLDRWRKEFMVEGKWQDHNPENHVNWFLSSIRTYKDERLREVILEANNGNRLNWEVEKLTDSFDNYTVRATMMEKRKNSFPIKDKNDPIEILLSALVPYVSQYLLEDGEQGSVTCRGKTITITKDHVMLRYKTEADLLNGKPDTEGGKATTVTTAPLIHEAEELDDSFYLDFLNVDEYGNFNDYVPVSDIEKWDTSFRKEFYLPKAASDLFSSGVEKINMVDYVKDALRDKQVFNNFKLAFGQVIINCKSLEEFNVVRLAASRYKSTSTVASRVFVKYGHRHYVHAGMAVLDDLKQLDAFMTDGLANVLQKASGA
jgi:hypothetical protein